MRCCLCRFGLILGVFACLVDLLGMHGFGLLGVGFACASWSSCGFGLAVCRHFDGLVVCASLWVVV